MEEKQCPLIRKEIYDFVRGLSPYPTAWGMIQDKKIKFFIKISINKYLRKTLKLMDPILSDQRLWIIVTEFSKPLPARLGKPVLVRPELPDPEISQIRSPGLTLHKKTETKSETIFVEGLNILDRPKMLSPMQKEFS